MVPKVVAKPFVSVYPEDLPCHEELRAFDLLSDRLLTRCQTALVSRVIEKIYGNPDLHDHVLSLYSGPSSDPYPSYPPMPRKEPRHLNPLIPPTDIDVAKIEAICTYNNFTPNSLEIGPHDMTVENPAALYLLPSFFNHACASNAAWHCVGDAMVIRATVEIAAGDEITISYACSESYHERRTSLGMYLPQGCDCRLCEADRQDGEQALQHRDRLFFDSSQPRVDPVSALERARAFVSELKTTFSPTRSAPFSRMGNAHHMVAVALQEVAYDADKETRLTYFKDAIAEDIKGLESAGMTVIDKSTRGPAQKRTLPIATTCLPSFIPHEHFVIMMLSIAYAFNVLRDRRRVIRWIRAAAWGAFFFD
jgi:hypothetical protein